MMINFIVGSAIIMAIIFFAAWLLFPGLRARIEEPKYAFLDRVNAGATLSDTGKHKGSGEQTRD